MLLASMPVGELRASIPVALTIFDMSPFQAYAWSVLGNALPVFFIVFFFSKGLLMLEKKIPSFHAWLERYFYRLSKKHEKKIEKYGALFLIIFVAIPSPASGVWSASLLSVLFRLDKRKAISAIFVGMLLAGLIVLVLSQSLIG